MYQVFLRGYPVDEQEIRSLKTSNKFTTNLLLCQESFNPESQPMDKKSRSNLLPCMQIS